MVGRGTHEAGTRSRGSCRALKLRAAASRLGPAARSTAAPRPGSGSRHSPSPPHWPVTSQPGALLVRPQTFSPDLPPTGQGATALRAGSLAYAHTVLPPKTRQRAAASKAVTRVHISRQGSVTTKPPLPIQKEKR